MKLGFVNCINPNHDDKNPSMAVYDHGKGKLQVFCFSCKYHGWVTPEALPPIVSGGSGKGKGVDIHLEHGQDSDVRHRAYKFFMDRNFNTIPIGAFEFGTYRVNESWIRPAIKWDLWWAANQVGQQCRFLDDKKPKTVYVPDERGEYPKMSEVNIINDYSSRTLLITESFIDGLWVKEKTLNNYPIITSLGTGWDASRSTMLYELLDRNGYRTLGLFFDDDQPGRDCCKFIHDIVSVWGVSTFNYSGINGEKVYQLENVEVLT